MAVRSAWVVSLLAAGLAGCLGLDGEPRFAPLEPVPAPGPSPAPAPPPAAATAHAWPPAEGAGLLRLAPFLEGLERPVDLVHAGDGSERLFVVEQTGRVRVVRDGQVMQEPFLDLRGHVSRGVEQGLFSVAFPPDFGRSGRAYVHFTDLQGDTRVVRYAIDPAEPDRLDPASASPVLHVEQPKEVHNGGALRFGPDGMLYVALGDGGRNGYSAQMLERPLGKVLRLDVGVVEGYRVPADNPFASVAGARPETWHLGLRNPFHVSFDRATGDLWMGDVGHGSREEIDLAPSGSKGLNFGWNRWEGTRRNLQGDTTGEVTWPVAEYTHEEGCAVIGGHVYRGAAIPALRGVYLYGDFCKGTIWGLARDAQGAWRSAVLHRGDALLTGFGEDAEGELYALYHPGRVLRILPP